MLSRCCRAESYSAQSLYCCHLENDYFECSLCLRACDMFLINEEKEGKQDE
jgi:hypothetical protein